MHRIIVRESLWRRSLQRAAIYSPAVWCEVPPPLTVTSLPSAGGHGTVIHRLRRHAQLGGRIPPGLGWRLFPRGRAPYLFIPSSSSSTSSVPTTDRMEGLGADREALPTGKGMWVGHGHTFLGVWHGNGAHAQVLAFGCNVLSCPKNKEREE